MTPPPPAATAAPRVGGSRRLAGRSGSRIPRRVSGPARPRSLRAAAGGLALPRPIDLRIPKPSARAAGDALARARGVFRGRGLIVLLAGMLLGLVFLQVSLLKLNTQITQNVERAQALERDNASKRTVISQLDAGRRIQDVAGQLGMVMPGAGSVCYLDAGRTGSCSGGDPAAAASAVDPVAETAPVTEAVLATPGAEAAPTQETPAAEPEAAAPVAQETAPAVQETAPAAQEQAPTTETAPVAQAPTEQTTAAGGIAAGGTP
jgi:hypothetical protein